METAFYTAGVAAKAQQDKLNIIGNNMANANTNAYKSQNAGFVDLLYRNIRDAAGVDTPLRVGNGTRVDKTDINYNDGGIQATENPTDYTIIGSGFFAVQNPTTNEVFYTRDGSFKASEFADGEFYLVTGSGEVVLDDKMQRINMNLYGKEEEKPVGTDPNNPEAVVTAPVEQKKPGIFDFAIKDGMLLAGDNRFSPTAKNGAPMVNTNSQLQTAYLELSNVEVAEEMVKLIEAQRVYSMALKMVQTSNEIGEILGNIR